MPNTTPKGHLWQKTTAHIRKDKGGKANGWKTERGRREKQQRRKNRRKRGIRDDKSNKAKQIKKSGTQGSLKNQNCWGKLKEKKFKQTRAHICKTWNSMQPKIQKGHRHVCHRNQNPPVKNFFKERKRPPLQNNPRNPLLKATCGHKTKAQIRKDKHGKTPAIWFSLAPAWPSSLASVMRTRADQEWMILRSCSK